MMRAIGYSYRMTEYPSGAALCCVTHGDESVIVINRDHDASPSVRADRARQEVDRILMMVTDQQVTLP